MSKRKISPLCLRMSHIRSQNWIMKENLFALIKGDSMPFQILLNIGLVPIESFDTVYVGQLSH